MPAFPPAPRRPAWITPPSSSPTPYVLTIERSTGTFVATFYREASITTVPIAATTTVGAASARSSAQKGGVSGPVAGGVIVGSVTIFVLLVVLGCFCCRRRSSSTSWKHSPSPSEDIRPQPFPPYPPGPMGAQLPGAPPFGHNPGPHPAGPAFQPPPPPPPPPPPLPRSNTREARPKREESHLSISIKKVDGRRALVVKPAKRAPRTGWHAPPESASSVSSSERRRKSRPFRPGEGVVIEDVRFNDEYYGYNMPVPGNLGGIVR